MNHQMLALERTCSYHLVQLYFQRLPLSLPTPLSTSGTALNFYKILFNKSSIAFKNLQAISLTQLPHVTDVETKPQKGEYG